MGEVWNLLYCQFMLTLSINSVLVCKTEAKDNKKQFKYRDTELIIVLALIDSEVDFILFLFILDFHTLMMN